MVKFCPDQSKLVTTMKVLFNLLGLFCIMVVSDESDEEETGTLKPTMVDRAKEYLQDDDITLKIVEKFFELNFNPELKVLMHLSLNHLLVVRQLLAHDSDNLEKMPEFNQFEYDRTLRALETQEKQEAFKMEHEQISSEISSYINLPFDTSYTGGTIISPSEVESLANLLPAEELISPLRKGSVHTLLSQFLGTLMLGELYAFSIFEDDKVTFNKGYWKKLLKAYPEDDRSYLGRENSLILIPRTGLQGLPQIRLMRTQISPKLVTLEQRLENIHSTLDNQMHRENLLTLVNGIHTKLDEAEDFRILASKENQARHDAVISTCHGSGLSNPFEDDDEDIELDYNRGITPQRTVNRHNIVNSTPCPKKCSKIDFNPFRKYLRICPTQKVMIPSEVRNLGTHYRLIDRSLTGIKNTLDELETYQLMSQLTQVSTFITQDFAEISETLDFIQLNYNTSLNFFHSFDQSLNTIQTVYTDYNLFIVLYCALLILGTLFLIKVVTLLVYCVNGWPKVTGFKQDLNKYRRNKDTGINRNDNIRGDQQVEMPLIRRVR